MGKPTKTVSYSDKSFTGAARQGKEGLVQLANGGTLFLDEIGELPLDIQAKLLQVIQNKEVRSIGAVSPTPVDFRIICATNRDLRTEVRAGRFREDFYYRINVINLKLPPLRERVEDIPLLTDYFIKCFNSELDMHITGISPEALALLQGYSWPGNIRELENCLERAFNYARGGGLLQAEHIKLTPSHAAEVVPPSGRQEPTPSERPSSGPSAPPAATSGRPPGCWRSTAASSTRSSSATTSPTATAVRNKKTDCQMAVRFFLWRGRAGAGGAGSGSPGAATYQRPGAAWRQSRSPSLPPPEVIRMGWLG